ncbi:alpha/beta fold hydrolase [Streptomyces aureocirculatus]|uniref:alpha/beta fold hydrolase n=1 Tax=Streptomyces aureocirculatus TaxID=67275 RepID=UPI0007C4DB38|nr:alpha/beta hydrolase [Streptomyces aureocirculatus]
MTGSRAEAPRRIEDDTVLVNGIRLRLRRCGEGPLLILLHGWPQTGYCWRHVMPLLASSFTVVAPDLRGYGDSSRPPAGYDKRTMAEDMSKLTHTLGFRDACVVGHDRGARVAHRWALDRPDEVRALGLLSIIPTREMWRRMDAMLARAYWHWFFHYLPDLPEHLIAGREDSYIRFLLQNGALHAEAFNEDDLRHYADAYRKPGAMRTTGADYRAGATTDITDDDHDAKAGNRLTMPTLVLWGEQDLISHLPVAEIWRPYADHLTCRPLKDCGHFLAEEQPGQLHTLLTTLLLNSARATARSSNSVSN